MRIKTILLGLILGTSTVAVAQPQRPYDHDRDHRGHYGDHYDQRGRVVNRWLTLTAGVPTTDYRHIINVNPNAGRFEKIRLSIDSGRVFVRQVAVIFADGTNRKFRIDRTMRAGEVAEIDLPGRFRAIERVIVYNDPARRWRNSGTYSVVAQRPVVRPQYGYGNDEYWRQR
jgi:hypothetical protein